MPEDSGLTPAFTVDTSRLQVNLERLTAAVGHDLGPRLVKEEMGQFVRSIVANTQPGRAARGALGFLGGKSLGGITDKKIGENAVRRDLDRVFNPLNDQRILKLFGAHRAGNRVAQLMASLTFGAGGGNANGTGIAGSGGNGVVGIEVILYS